MAVRIVNDNDYPSRLLEISTVLEQNKLSLEERGNFVYVYINGEVVAFPKRDWREVATALFNFAKE